MPTPLSVHTPPVEGLLRCSRGGFNPPLAQEFQKMEEELSKLREQGRSEQGVPLAERLLRDIAADQQGDVVAQ